MLVPLSLLCLALGNDGLLDSTPSARLGVSLALMACFGQAAPRAMALHRSCGHLLASRSSMRDLQWALTEPMCLPPALSSSRALRMAGWLVALVASTLCLV